MKYVAEFFKCLRQMERVSKALIAVGAGLTALTYLIAGITLFVYAGKYNDYSTGLCWFEDLTYLAKELLGASVVPVLLFEILCIVKGLKSTECIKK